MLDLSNIGPSNPPRESLNATGRGDLGFQVPASLTLDNSLDEILAYARKQDVSDVHLSVNKPIIFRKYGALQAATNQRMTSEKMLSLLQTGINPSLFSEFVNKGDLEYVHTIEGAGRYRVMVIKQRVGWDLTARLIPMSIRRFEDSGMPESCRNLTKWAQGLVLVTGPIGCGKTSTLSTLVEMINQTRAEHIITIENPIEVVFKPAKCEISQRELNVHTQSPETALRAALREDPDILVVSELRDLTTIQLAITAAETGHLVFGTMNTNSAAQTITRVIDSFPPDGQPIIRNMISESLRGVISQQLIPRKDGKGVVPAYEVLIVNTSVANLIREQKLHQISVSMTTGKSQGMVLFDQSLRELVAKGIIAQEQAVSRAFSPKEFTSSGMPDAGEM